MMRRYLLVLDMDLLAVDEQLGLEPVSYLLARHEEQPSEVVVLSLADHRQARLSALELLLGTSSNITKFPVAPQPGHDIGAAAEHRMNLAVRHLRVIGCQASGLISDDDLVTAVRTETRVHHYDQVIMATGRQPGTWLARALRRDPAHRLRPRLGQRLIVSPSIRACRTPGRPCPARRCGHGQAARHSAYTAGTGWPVTGKEHCTGGETMEAGPAPGRARRAKERDG
jgi:hypothetical protein